ncbi:MAG: glycosyltransferase family 39 protein [Phycisphaerales bacterium]|nr:glycosyltransferase family 39 protein [Phycisphaerales bacterium]
MTSKNLLPVLIVITCVLIYIIGFWIPVMDVDAAQYATMSRELLLQKNWLFFYDYGRDYLDKPPFLFWISAISMKIFGVNNFGYRFPSLIFAVLAIYATFRFAKLYYSNQIAVLSAIILASSQALFLITHDVRTDTILMSWVILAIWQLAAWYQTNHIKNLIMGACCIGFGMLTKGPVVLIVLIVAFGSHFLLQRKLIKNIFRKENLLILFIVALILLPMSIGLYQQFDSYPNKIVNGHTGVSGLKFYYWTQSFGRITGENDFNDHWPFLVQFFFLLQNMLWTFLPWILFFFIGIYVHVQDLFHKKFYLQSEEEGITIGGFILTYCCLSLSHSLLPHYIFIVFPLVAIITAKVVYAMLFENKYSLLKRILSIVYPIVFLLLWVALLLLLWYIFPDINRIFAWLSIIFMLGFIYLLVKRNTIFPKLLVLCLYCIIALNLIISGAVYPKLLTYQMGSSVGMWIHDNNIPVNKFYRYADIGEYHSLNFYAQHIVPAIADMKQLTTGDYVLTTEHTLKMLDSAHHTFDIVYQGLDFHVTMLDWGFLNPMTRNTETQPYFVVKIKS